MTEDQLAGYLRVDRAGTLVEVNREALRILGYGVPEDLAGRPFAVVTTLADRVFLQTYVQPTLALGPREELTISLRSRTNELVPVLATARAVEDGGFALGFLTMRLRSVAASDVVEARLGEARAHERLGVMEAELAQAGRLASIGELAAAVAHEINNPLAYVSANVELLATEEPTAEERGRLIADVQHGLGRIRDIIASLKKMSRVDNVTARPVSCTGVLEDALKIAGNAIRHRARLEISCEPEIAVMAEEGRLAQVIVNLLTNAVQALPEDRATENRISISVRGFDRWVELEVSDNGPGIPAEIQARIFEPFFTTKPLGEGTGLGLSVCQGVVASFGGSICVESEIGKGARFTIRLPIAKSADVSPPVVAPAPPPVRATGRMKLIVVDDDDAIVRVLRRVFRDHEVEWFPRAVEAWKRFEQDAFAGADAVLCDLMLPEMSGMELYQRVTARSPAVSARFLFLTGGAFSESARIFLESVDRHVLAKPFAVAKLRAAVVDVASQPHAK